MSKDKISDYSATANSNTDIGGINIDEGCAPSGINDAIRTLMKQLKDWQSGSQDVYIHPAGSASVPSITATGDTNTGLFFPAADTVGITTGGTERARVDSSGNLGLGVTPSAWATYKALQVDNGAIANYSPTQDASYLSNAYYNAGWKYIASAYALRYAQDGSGGSHKWYNAASGTAGNTITFTQAMTLDASGALLTGGTSYYGDWGGGAGTIQATSTSYANISAGSSRSDQNSVRIGSFTFDWSTNTSGYRTRAIIEAQSNGSTANKRGADLLFYTASDNVASPTERARIDSSGNLLVGTTSGSWTTVSKSNSGSYSMTITNPNYGAGDGCLIVKAGNGSSGPYIINCESNSAAVFRVYGNGTYGTVSDLNLKKNIETARNYLSDLMQLRVVKYNWKVQDDTEPKELGFIAQEVEQVFPGLVETSTREGEMDNKLIKQPVLIPILVKAIQELKAELDAAKARITALEA